VANDLAQQASGFRSNRGRLCVLKKPNFLVCQIRCSSFQQMHSVAIYSAEPDSAKLDGPISETKGPEFLGSRIIQVKRR
jgi:hypothetical protein